MRVAVVGAGAIGILVAARLARAGADVAVVARGEALEALRIDGLRVRDREGRWTASASQVGRAAEVGPRDVVIVCLKAHAIAAALGDLVALRGPGTRYLFAANGMPWWYFHRHPAWRGSPHLETVDPGGAIWNAIGPENAAAMIVHAGASVVAAGEIHHAWGAKLVLGSTDPAAEPQLVRIGELLDSAGFRSTVATDIRAETWRKLAYNLAIGPVSLISGASCDQIAASPALARLMEAMIEEALAVARATGTDPGVVPAQQVRGFAAIGPFRTSMLQDLDVGRTVELEPILGSVDELAARMGIAAPRIAEVLALARLRAAQVVA